MMLNNRMDRGTLYKLIMMKWDWDPHTYVCQSELVDVFSASMILGVSVRTLRNWARRRIMPPRQKREKTYYYRRVDIKLLGETIASSNRPAWMALIKRKRPLIR